VMGGRWKPLHYWYRRALYADTLATCDADGLCYVRHDGVAAFNGRLVLNATELDSGRLVTLQEERVALDAGPGAIVWFRVPQLGKLDATTHVVEAIVLDEDGTTVASNLVLLATPEHMQLPRSNVTVRAEQRPDGTLVAHVSVSATAMWVTLTTLAHGRFEDNAFLLRPPGCAVAFLPTVGAPATTLAEFTKSLRVEDVSTYMDMYLH
jgi:beta-mannosidase